MINPFKSNVIETEIGINMFTVKIVNNNEGYTSIRSWATVDIIRKGTETFNELIRAEKEKWNHEGMKEDQVIAMHEAIDTYSAILRTVDGETDYYLCEHQTAYIMDGSGSTVEVVR